jgi:hypothetical protein
MYIEIIEFCDSPNFYSLYRSLNLTTCLMYVEIVDLVGKTIHQMIIRPYEIELLNVRINTSISCYH